MTERIERPASDAVPAARALPPYGLRRGWHPYAPRGSGRAVRLGDGVEERGEVDQERTRGADGTPGERAALELGLGGSGAPALHAPRRLIDDPVLVHADARVEGALD